MFPVATPWLPALVEVTAFQRPSALRGGVPVVLGIGMGN